MKDFLIFTGVGDDTQFLSWAENSNPYFDRGINIYKKTDKTLKLINKINPEILLTQTGEIWNVLVDNYHLFTNYKYILIIDSDIDIAPTNIEATFLKAKNNNWSGCQWSRNPNTFCGNPKRVQKWFTKKSGIRETNFIEMIFMLVRQDLLNLTIKKWKEFDLKYSFGCDLVLANTAQKNNMLPFYVLDDFEFYNPHPHEKKNKERVIDKELKSTVKDRGAHFKKNAISKDKIFFQINWKNAYVK